MNKQIPSAPSHAPMFEDDAPATLAEALREIRELPADYGLWDAFETLRVTLVRFGWEHSGLAQISTGDSGSPVVWRVTVGAFGSVDVDEIEAGRVERSTTFRGGYHVSVLRTLAFLAANQS